MLTTLLLVSMLSAPVQGQQPVPVAIEMANVTMAEIFSTLKSAFKVKMVCRGCDLKKVIPALSFANAPKRDVFNSIAEAFGLAWTERQEQVVWTPKPRK